MKRQKNSYEQKITQVENEKNEVIKKAYEEADNYLKEVQSKAKNLIDRISQDEVKKEEAKKCTEKPEYAEGIIYCR